MTVTFDSAAPRRFRTGVSLHSHTLHSRESLAILYRLAAHSPLLTAGVRLIEREFLRATGKPVDLNRAWWTPPLAPLQAWRIERAHIEAAGLSPIVSITDHDNIDAPMSLRVLDECRSVPVSLEWTVPFENIFFHLGVHNLPHPNAAALMARFERYTAASAGNLADLLDAVAQCPDSLVILNHPYWDETGIGAVAHEAALRRFVLRYGQFIHAVELNGLRPWPENKRVLSFAQSIDRPLVSGGDRHGTEPNTVLNLTQATGFGDFAEEIRSGRSNVLITARYREPHALRMLHNFEVMAGDIENHAHAWCHWSERVFYQNDNGDVESLKQVLGGRVPRVLNAPFSLLKLLSVPGMRRAMRMIAPRPCRLTAEAE
jgi:hypothetical protein